MPYFDIDEEQEQTPAAEAENRRKVLGLIASAGKVPLLGPRPPVPRTEQPNEPPVFGTPPIAPTSRPPFLGGAPPPVRPNVQPRHEDFPEKPLPTWQKVLGVAAAPFLPNLTQTILGGPKRKAGEQYGRAVQDWEREQTDEARAATTAKTRADTAVLGQPKPKEEQWEVVPNVLGPNGEPVQQEKNSGQIRVVTTPGITVKEPKQGTATFEEQTYQEWKQTHPNGTRMQFEKERSTNTQKPEKPQRTLVTVPQPDGSAKIIEAQPGMTIPKGARTVTEFGKEQAPTADEQRRADLGKNLNENLDTYEEIVRRRPDLFGPIAGRGTALKMMTGSSDPDIAALRAVKEFAGMAAVGTHAMRNAQHVKIASDAMMNLNDEPEAILAEKGPLSRARTSIQTFIGDVSGQRVQDKAAGAVNVIAPDGTPGTIPRANLQKALKQGYKQAQ